MRIAAAVIMAWLLAGCPRAIAADHGLIRSDLTCGAMVAMLDGGSGQEAGYVGQFIVDVFIDSDRVYTKKRLASIVDPLSYDGLTGLVAMTIVRCRQSPASSLRTQAIGVYTAIRDLNDAAHSKG